MFAKICVFAKNNIFDKIEDKVFGSVFISVIIALLRLKVLFIIFLAFMYLQANQYSAEIMN